MTGIFDSEAMIGIGTELIEDGMIGGVIPRGDASAGGEYPPLGIDHE